MPAMTKCDDHTALVKEQGRQGGILEALVKDVAGMSSKIDEIHTRITSNAVNAAEFKGKVNGGFGLMNYLLMFLIGVAAVAATLYVGK